MNYYHNMQVRIEEFSLGEIIYIFNWLRIKFDPVLCHMKHYYWTDIILTNT